MHYVNCKICLGKGYLRYTTRSVRCSFCYGKKKVSSDFVEWEELRSKYGTRVLRNLQNLLNQDLKKKMEAWDETHPKPRKFKKENNG